MSVAGKPLFPKRVAHTTTLLISLDQQVVSFVFKILINWSNDISLTSCCMNNIYTGINIHVRLAGIEGAIISNFQSNLKR